MNSHNLLRPQARPQHTAAVSYATHVADGRVVFCSGGQNLSTECSMLRVAHSSRAVAGCSVSSIGGRCEYSCDAGYTEAGPLVCNSDPSSAGRPPTFSGGGCYPCPDGFYLNGESMSCVQCAACVDEELAAGTTAHNTVCASWITTDADEDVTGQRLPLRLASPRNGRCVLVGCCWGLLQEFVWPSGKVSLGWLIEAQVLLDQGSQPDRSDIGDMQAVRHTRPLLSPPVPPLSSVPLCPLSYLPCLLLPLG